MFYLQNRWKHENNRLQYYGLRNKPDMFKNTVKLNSKQNSIVSKLPCELNENEQKIISNFIGIQVVNESDLKTIPASLEEAQFCKTCISNDYIIPGLEFDADGICPMCQTKEQTAHLKSIVPII